MKPQQLSNGVVLWRGRKTLEHAEVPPGWLDQITQDGRTQRERLAAMELDLERLTSGWVPNAADLADAPVLNKWRLAQQEDELLPWLVGISAGHPHIPEGRVVGTSSLVAIDAASFVWARAASRFYRLGRPLDAELSS